MNANGNSKHGRNTSWAAKLASLPVRMISHIFTWSPQASNEQFVCNTVNVHQMAPARAPWVASYDRDVTIEACLSILMLTYIFIL